MTKTVYLKPECSPPPIPALPNIDAGVLWDRVGQSMYNDLELREKRLVDVIEESAKMIKVLCK